MLYEECLSSTATTVKTLKIYKSSAGSGKTFTLVTEYLKLILKTPDDYKAVLAITFTNKAAAEMKSRIIDALVSLSKNEDSSLKNILSAEFPNMDIAFVSGKALKNILHDYSSFSVSTIDSFFQRILRALAREIHLPLNMDVQVELDDAILDVTARLLNDVGINKDLTDWLTDLALQKLDDDKGWNIEKDIESVAWELFKEERYNEKSLSREEIQEHYKKMLFLKREFEKSMRSFGENALSLFSKNGVEISDFAYGEKGVASYFRKITKNNDPSVFKLEGRIADALEDSEKWVTKKNPRRTELLTLAEQIFLPRLREISEFVKKNFTGYATASEILRKIYLFGIMNDLQKKFSEFRNENNIILLSDTARLLSDIIRDSDAPFIYEKTGNRYKHLLIDEFQDTSLLQWKNLLPLIINTLGSGFNTLIVGDAKQSIYRWRGGNMNLLLKDVFSDLAAFKSLLKEEVLSTNYRSKKEIVEFNNQFFEQAPQIANGEIGMNDFPALNLAYGPGIKQQVKLKDSNGGFVQVSLLENSLDEDGEKISWKEQAMDDSIQIIHDLLKKNYSFKDICILVRKNKEGNEFANRLFENGIENIISPDSLLITASPKITFLINVFRFLLDNSNMIARSEILFYFSTAISKNTDDIHHLFIDHKNSGIKKRSKKSSSPGFFEGLEDNFFNKILPEKFTAHITYLGKLPVYELSEQLIEIFSLTQQPDAYIQRFQDLVLEYSTQSNSSIEGFLQWWDGSKNVRDASVMLPENTDAIRIMTIHRSKGLQFPIVIMPFADWPLLPKANDLLWLNTANSEFEKLGKVAVSSGKRLLDTIFKTEYESEINQTVIDNLNLLYVAFTRAEEKLFIIGPVDKESNLNSISKLINRTCLQMDATFDGRLFKLGEDDTNGSEPGSNEHAYINEQLTSYPSTRWQEKLSLTTRSGNLVSLLEDTKLNKVNYGILVHDILASIQDTQEVEYIIETKVFEGLIGFEEMAVLKKEITEVLSTPEISKYFEKGYEVLAERDIILTGGELLRPDRVLIKNNKAIVIDFKTGKREKKHEEQVNRYAEILRLMNYENVEAVIIYLADRSVNIL